MFGFLRNRVYRKMFINFSAIVLIIIFLFVGLVYSQVIKTNYQNIMQNNQYASEYIESSIRMKQSIIEERLNKIYNNEKSFNDLMNFFMMDMDEYLASRLDSYKLFEYYPTISKFGEECIYNDTDITSVIIYDHVKEQMMVYSTNPILVLRTWKASEYEVDQTLQKSGGFFIKKEISDPTTLEILGTIYITYNEKKVFASINQFDSGDIIMVRDDSYIILNDNIKSPYVSDNIDLFINQSKMEGKISTGFMSDVQFNTHLLVGYDYKIMTFVDRTMVKIENLTLLLFLVISLALFIGAEFFIAKKVNKEARDLNKIITSIKSVKTGDFVASDVVNRKDEFGIIARELNDMFIKLDEYIMIEYKLKLEQKQMQFDLLQSQMNPHFLYNTLEIMKARALLNYDTEVANAISNLGGLYRDLLEFGSIIPLKDELRLAKRYLDMMSFIYEQRFFYTIDVDDDILEFKTIKFWIQSLTENFFVHGIDRNSEMNALIVRGYRSNDKVYIEIQDNGLGLDKEKAERINQNIKNGNKNEGIGLSNVYDRLTMYYGDGIDMKIIKNDRAGVTVMIELEEGRDVQTSNSG